MAVGPRFAIRPMVVGRVSAWRAGGGRVESAESAESAADGHAVNGTVSSCAQDACRRQMADKPGV